jgi:threonine aldolase
MPAMADLVADRYQFASDNTAGLCPEAMEAMVSANTGYSPAYGNDPYTTRVSDLFREIFETDCDVYFVFNGTAANSLALATLCQPYHAVIAHDVAHVETDECGGPEFFSGGTKLLLAAGDQGRLDPAAVEHVARRRTDIHYPPPRALSLTQSTELGTVYSPEEITRLCAVARANGLRVHMDGARFANAVAALGWPPRALTWEAGVDVLCCGGTKIGGWGEAVVFFDRALSVEFAYRCKQAGQLASKMRFLAAPWLRLLEDGLWLRGAAHANRMARRLRAGIEAVPGLELLYPTQANAVFVRMPDAIDRGLRARGWHYYVFIGGGARLMCSWATTEADVDSFVADALACAER